MNDDTERGALVAFLHARNEFDYDQCDHGTYAGPLAGQPYAMCERQADAILTEFLPDHDERVRAEQQAAVRALPSYDDGLGGRYINLRLALRAIREAGKTERRYFGDGQEVHPGTAAWDVAPIREIGEAGVQAIADSIRGTK